VGEYFVGAIGLCFVLALVSGVVYAPFARKPGFASVRKAKTARRAGSIGTT
jgi:uncharacterized iron-regulated membrane protein